VRQSSSGFTLVEVLIAVTVLGIGILALAGSLSIVTRMIGRGKIETHAAAMASARMEMLRAAAQSTTPRCVAPDFASGGSALVGGVRDSWLVPLSGAVRRVRVAVTYRTASGVRSAVLETAIQC
jgi:prepilin-type N-terminal cleavage/methylation domain-containing protein